MSLTVDFQCRGESPEEIPAAIINLTGTSYSKAHTDKYAMAAIAEHLKEYKGDCICRVPFCLTVEAEALGAQVIIPEEKTGPRFANYKFDSIEELVEIKEMDLRKGRINEVLNCVEILKKKGNTVALNVEGAFSILALLIDPVKLFKGIGKHRELVEGALQVIENSVVKYIMAGIEKGAKLISYADPTGALEIVGPKIFREISGKASCNILKRVEEAKLNDALVHLCGKTSTAFEKTGFCKVKPVTVAGGLTYGQAICQLNQGQGVKFIGHGCMKSTPVSMRQPVLWQVELV